MPDVRVSAGASAALAGCDYAGLRVGRGRPLTCFGYATQTPGTATFWNRCGDATADDG